MKFFFSIILLGQLALLHQKVLAQDTLTKPSNFSAYVTTDVTNIGFYGGLGVQKIHNKFAYSLAYIIDYSKAELPANGPFGFDFGLGFYPNLNNEKTLNHFINLDYRLVFHKRYCVYNCDQKYNKSHEINLGYGLMVKIYKNLKIQNTINIGWYVENAVSDRTGKKLSYSGVNSLLQFKLMYQF